MHSGISRQIGFIGFKTEEEATAAVDFFNNTYLDTSKLSVTFAESVVFYFHVLMGQKGKVQARPWSRYSKGSSAYLRLHPEEKQIKGKMGEDEEETEETLKQKETQKKKGRKW